MAMNANNSKAVKFPDRDSLVALDALLRIRDSGAFLNPSANAKHHVRTDRSSLPRDPLPSSSTAHPAQAASLPELVAKLSSFLPLNAANMFLNHHQQYATMSPSPAQVHLASVQAASAKNWGTTLLAAGAPSPSSTNKISPVTVPERVALDREAKPEVPGNDQDSLTAAEAIRKEKVAEALRSKPQRGRKRDNLSEKERLELTRTRNREHAKSTRIRKKARYQELLDREELFLEMKEEEERQSQRRQIVQDFFSARQSMLLDRVRQHVNDQSSDQARSSCEKRSHASGERVRSNLCNIIDASESFDFESLLPGGAEPDTEDAMSKMIEWDQALLESIARNFGNLGSDVLSSVAYEIESGVEGIAFNKNGEVFCRAELSLRLPSTVSKEGQFKNVKKILLSGVCSAKFSSQSQRLVSFKWTTLEDRCSSGRKRPAPEDAGSSVSQQSRETLGSQLVHPSVVSLDHVRHVDSDENQQGPGMSI